MTRISLSAYRHRPRTVRLSFLTFVSLASLSLGCARGASRPAQGPEGRAPASAGDSARDVHLVERARILPRAAHHQHLIGPAYLAAWHPAPMAAAALPPVLDSVLRRHQALIGAPVTSESYRDVYADSARLLHAEQIVKGSAAIARRWTSYREAGFVRYVVPLHYELRQDDGSIVGVMVETRPDSSTRYAHRLMHVLMNVRKGGDGRWRIVSESGTPMNRAVNTDTITAANLIAHMNEAGATHGVIAAIGYQFAKGPEKPGERALVQAENDWTVQQAAQFPGRLVVFCGLNPIRGYAIAEMDRCAKMPGVRGMKLYLANRVNLADSADVAKLREFVRAANDRRLPLLVHLSMDASDGALHARIFLEQVVPVAPDIPIQIAHMGSGKWFDLGAADDALRVFSDAAAARNPLMTNLFFDVTGSVYGWVPAAAYDTLARRMRTIGLKRILFGSDLPLYPQEKVSGAWAKFRQFTPLTNEELRVIAENVAPYAR
jgi:predicted TIM-barrel fold metal-dependent hydrolase